MTTRKERIEKALDTLAELCDVQNPTDDQYGRRGAAEEILRHYREKDMTDPERGVVVRVYMEGHVPVRPIERKR